nr:unnamed protein product [Spirometra erinaceieuropaei]
MQTFVAEGQYAVVVEVNNGLDGTFLNYTVSVFPECHVRFPGPLPSVRARTPVLYNLASSSPANCKYHWMLNGEYMNETRIPERELFYEKSGKYNVCVAAENLAGRVFPVYEYQTVTSQIYGLQLVSECCSRKSCDIQFAYLDGAVIGASLTINGVVFAPELDKNDREIIFRAGSQTVDTLNVILTAISTDEHVEVEGKVRVDSPLEDMKVTLSTNTALIGHPVEVRVVLRGGTSGEIRIMYDAVIQRRRLFAPGQAMDTKPHLFTHTFAQNGAHWICVSVTAAAQQRKSCLLLVVDAALYNVYPLRLTPSKGLRVHTPLKLAIGAGDLAERSPLGMFLTVDWSDGSSPTQLANYELGALVEHIYQEAGCYKIRAELTKGQQQVRLFANLEVTAPLHNLMCYMGTAEVAVGQMVPLYAFWRSAKKVDYELLRDGKLIMHGTKSVPFSSVCTFADKATKTGVNAYALRISDNQTSLNCTPSITVVNVDFILNFIVRTSYIEIPGILVPILKKGDKTRCENYRGISLIDVAAKIFAIALLRRFQAVRDSRTRPNQAGFRAGLGCADQLFTLRRILEFRHSYQQPTAVCFVDFAAAFDSVHRESLRRIMALDGVPAKIIAMIKAYYRSTTARVLVRNNLSQPFGIRSGVRQGCILSPILFNYAIDWILGRVLRDSDGVEFAPGHRLTDIDYVDDIALLASSFGDLQSMVSRVNEVAKSVGLSINAGKTKVFSSCIPDQEKAPLGIDGCQLEEVDSFKYLGARLLPNGQSKDDIVSRIDAARWVFSSLRKCLWNRRDLSIATKIRVYRASVRSLLLYGCECWALRVADERKLEVFDHHCLRIILGVKLTDFVSNEIVRARCDNIARITQAIQERRLRWFGHVLRRPPQELSVTALDPAPLPHWRRRRGGQLKTWLDTVRQDMEVVLGPSVFGLRRWRREWVELSRSAAADRHAWRGTIRDIIEAG